MANTFKQIQTQPWVLAGAGCAIGATSIIVSAFNDIDGVALTMTDFGDKGFGTLEAGNGTQEEQITWTGVTVNGDGTSTLTGVKSIGFKDPYTETSGVVKSHAGGTSLIYSNTASFYQSFARLGENNTISDVWTFTASPILPTPTTAYQGATKEYADGIAMAGGANASSTVKGISKLSLDPVAPTLPISVGDNDTRVPTQGENDALAGTSGTPSSSNKYVTNDDTATAATASKVARRLASGDITVNTTPTNTTDAASKAYADTKLSSLGSWASSTADGNGHQVTTDGFLLISTGGGAGGSSITVYSDSNATPTTLRMTSSSGVTGGYSNATVPIKKNDYYKVVISGTGVTTTALFIPIS